MLKVRETFVFKHFRLVQRNIQCIGVPGSNVNTLAQPQAQILQMIYQLGYASNAWAILQRIAPGAGSRLRGALCAPHQQFKGDKHKRCVFGIHYLTCVGEGPPAVVSHSMDRTIIKWDGAKRYADEWMGPRVWRSPGSW